MSTTLYVYLGFFLGACLDACLCFLLPKTIVKMTKHLNSPPFQELRLTNLIFKKLLVE